MTLPRAVEPEGGTATLGEATVLREWSPPHVFRPGPLLDLERLPIVCACGAVEIVSLRDGWPNDFIPTPHRAFFTEEEPS